MSGVTLSLGEAEALVAKAAKGAGLPWGLAAEAGRAARLSGFSQTARLGGGKAGDFGIGGGDDDDVAGRLAEVDGLGPVVDSARLCCQEVHDGPFLEGKG